MSISRRSLAGQTICTRRHLLATIALGLGSTLTSGEKTLAQGATPTTESSGWSYTDVVGNTETLSERPQRIATQINIAAALWDFGIEVPLVFGWTASHYPNGDHVAWGNIDVNAVEILPTTEEDNLELESLLAAQPDLIVTWTWNKDAPAESTNGVPADLADEIASIAPVLVLNQGDANDIELERIEAFAASLGADLAGPELTAAREAYQAKVAEIEQIVAEKPDLTILFASFEPDVIYVAGPDDVGDVGHLRALGLTIANDGSPTAGNYWEKLSTEQALRYPSDVLYIDQYGSLNTVEALQQHVTIGQHPAVKSGQAGPWKRDLPLSYVGLATFLETALDPLRAAKKVN